MIRKQLLWLLGVCVACVPVRDPSPAKSAAPTAAPTAGGLATPTAAAAEPDPPGTETDPPPDEVLSEEEYLEHEEHELLELAQLPTKPPTPAPGAPKTPQSSERHPFHQPLPAKETPASAPAMRYATLSAGACRAELKKRKLPVTRIGGNVRGIATPVRLPKELNGVRMIVPPQSSKWGMLDCRLALVLDDLTRLLARHDVTAMSVGNFYRPWSKLRKSVKSQHHYGLAADIVSFTLKDGRTLSVERDFEASIGERVCGPDAIMHTVTDEAVRLRNVVCEVAREKLFHHMLSPSFNAAHRDHFHWDIKRKGYATIVR